MPRQLTTSDYNSHFRLQLTTGTFAVLYYESIYKYYIMYVSIFAFEPDHEKMCLMPYANNKGAFVVRFFNSIVIPELAIS